MVEMDRRTSYFGYCGPIGFEAVTKICKAINQSSIEGYDDFVLSLDSFGGDISNGIYLYNHLKSTNINTIIFNTGGLSSIALVAFLGARRRLCSKNSMFMMHPVTTPPNHDGMSFEHLQSNIDAAIANDGRIHEILTECTSIPDAVLSKRKFSEVHITPNQALEYGVVHKIREFALPTGASAFQL